MGPLAVWRGGLGVWGGIAAGTLAGIVVLRRRGADVPRFLDAAAPGLLVAQAIGRVGNWFYASRTAVRRRSRGDSRSTPPSDPRPTRTP